MWLGGDRKNCLPLSHRKGCSLSIVPIADETPENPIVGHKSIGSCFWR